MQYNIEKSNMIVNKNFNKKFVYYDNTKKDHRNFGGLLLNYLFAVKCAKFL